MSSQEFPSSPGSQPPSGEGGETSNVAGRLREAIEHISTQEFSGPFNFRGQASATDPHTGLKLTIKKGKPREPDSTGAPRFNVGQLAIERPDPDESDYPLPEDPQIPTIFTTQEIYIQDGNLRVYTTKNSPRANPRLPIGTVPEETPLDTVLGCRVMDTFDFSLATVSVRREAEEKIVAMLTNTYSEDKTPHKGTERIKTTTDISASMSDRALESMLGIVESAAKVVEDPAAWKAKYFGGYG